MLAQEIIEEIDEDGSGTMDFDEFCQMMMSKYQNSIIFHCKQIVHTKSKEFKKKENSFLLHGTLSQKRTRYTMSIFPLIILFFKVMKNQFLGLKFTEVLKISKTTRYFFSLLRMAF